jgi:hypothetical protein
MLRTIIRIFVITLFLLGFGAPAVLADGPGIPPYCYPGPNGPICQ